MITPEALIERAWRERRVGNLEIAQDLLVEALRDLGDDPQTPQVATAILALRRLGHVHLDAQRPDRALDTFERALKLTETSDVSQRAHLLQHLGDAHRAAGRMGEAAARYEEALRLCRKLDQPPEVLLANVLRRLAITSEAAGDVGRAAVLWREALDLYQVRDVETGVEEAKRRLRALESRS